jgi:hypothetical protein
MATRLKTFSLGQVEYIIWEGEDGKPSSLTLDTNNGDNQGKVTFSGLPELAENTLLLIQEIEALRIQLQESQDNEEGEFADYDFQTEEEKQQIKSAIDLLHEDPEYLDAMFKKAQAENRKASAEFFIETERKHNDPEYWSKLVEKADFDMEDFDIAEDDSIPEQVTKFLEKKP